MNEFHIQSQHSSITEVKTGMSRRKKIIIVAVLTAVLAAGIIGGVVVVHAQTGSTGNTAGNTIMARVATILGIKQADLENAFAQAKKEQRDQALDTRLKNLVTQGKITQQQADQYKQWWTSRPNMPAGLPGQGHMMQPGGMRGLQRPPLSPIPPTTPKTS